METVFVSHLTPDQHQKVAKLVGKRCTVFYKMNGKTVEALWDAGAQLNITSKDWLQNNFPDLQVKSNKKRSHTQLDSRKQVIAFQDRVITINVKEAQHPLK